MSDPFGVYTYQAAQIQAQKHLSRGLPMLANYTWEKDHHQCDSEYPLAIELETGMALRSF